MQHSEFKDEAGAVQRLGNWFTISKADELAQDNSDSPEISANTLHHCTAVSSALQCCFKPECQLSERFNLVKGDYQRIKVFYIYQLRARWTNSATEIQGSGDLVDKDIRKGIMEE